jgi:chromate transporter
MGGILGATLATFAMFSPSFVMTLVFTELFVHVRNLKAVRGALAGVLASFTGMLAVVILQLSNATMKTPASFAFAAAAFIAVRWFKMDVIFVFAGGLVLWIGLMALHIV